METNRVLAVDDDPFILQLLKSGLGGYGLLVLTANDTRAARQILRSESVSFVLCDEEMPGGSGMELLRFVAAVHPHLPFLMVTGKDDLELARASVGAGAMDFVTKPFSIEALARRIELSRVRMERNRAHITEAVAEALDGAVRALVAAIDAKDPYTATHSERVAAIAERLGEAMDMASDLRVMLHYASLLHDVGKIAVPEEILTKPGKLTDEEWRIMAQHPVRSAEIVQHSPKLAEVASIIRHHHERLDGRGYPDGLSGEAIPLLTRVLTVADVYEATTADRAYRPAFSVVDARRLLREGCGSAFDPSVVSVLEGIPDLP